MREAWYESLTLLGINNIMSHEFKRIPPKHSFISFKLRPNMQKYQVQRKLHDGVMKSVARWCKKERRREDELREGVAMAGRCQKKAWSEENQQLAIHRRGKSMKSGKGKAQQESEGATKGSRLCWVHDVLAKAGTGWAWKFSLNVSITH